jgi:plastocyanin
MARLLRNALAVLSAIGLTGFLLPLAMGVAHATASVATIGVDHTKPYGHNFEYTDFFPRSYIRVHPGDVVNFQWADTVDGVHTATLLKDGETPDQAWTTVHPILEPDVDDPGPPLQFSKFATFPSPFGCGSTTPQPCSYDGSADVNSGANQTGTTPASPTPASFAVKMNVPAGRQVSFVCLVHRGMQGNLSVVDKSQPASSPLELTAQGEAQATVDNLEALQAEAAATPLLQLGGAVNLVAGTASEHVEVAEMLPQNATIRPGTKVRWVTLARKDIHTVTFPDGTPKGEPLPNFCELPNGQDTDAATSGQPCPNMNDFEIGFDPGPKEKPIITSPTTFASSGVIANLPSLPNDTSFSFPTAGTFTYQCKVHDHMVGTIHVQG